MSDPIRLTPGDLPPGRGGPQEIPRPPQWRLGADTRWQQPERITVADVHRALAQGLAQPHSSAAEVPFVALPGRSTRPAAVLCVLFDEDGQAHVVLTRRSSRLTSHTHQVSFPGGRLDPGEEPEAAALREAFEEVGMDPVSVELIGRLSDLRTALNPAPITPFVGALRGRPILKPNPAEVERAFTVPLVELVTPGVYREEFWVFPDGRERDMQFFELVGDTVWGATARMLTELLDLILVLTGPSEQPG